MLTDTLVIWKYSRGNYITHQLMWTTEFFSWKQFEWYLQIRWYSDTLWCHKNIFKRRANRDFNISINWYQNESFDAIIKNKTSGYHMWKPFTWGVIVAAYNPIIADVNPFAFVSLKMRTRHSVNVCLPSPSLHMAVLFQSVLCHWVRKGNLQRCKHKQNMNKMSLIHMIFCLAGEANFRVELYSMAVGTFVYLRACIFSALLQFSLS